jgi:WD40 repeat protein
MWQISWFPDGTHLAGGCSDGAVRIVDMRTGDIQTLVGHIGTATGVAIAPDGSLLSGGSDGTIRRWDLATGAGQIVRREPFVIEALIPIRDTMLVVDTQSMLQTIHVWNATSLPPVATDAATLAAWKARMTTAEVDAAGVVATP